VAAQVILQGWFDEPDNKKTGNPNAGDPNAAAGNP
jgi:hypothetical protein